MSCRIFLSYSHHDGPFVEAVAKLIRTTGTPVFRDKDSIPLGATWRALIAEALEGADTTIVFWSKQSANSSEVEAEYKQAISLNKPIIPICLDSTPLPADLSGFNGLDLSPFMRSDEGQETEVTSKRRKYDRRNAAMVRPEILYIARELKSLLLEMGYNGWEILLSPG